MPAVKIPARLERDENISFLDGHYQVGQPALRPHGYRPLKPRLLWVTLSALWTKEADRLGVDFNPDRAEPA